MPRAKTKHFTVLTVFPKILDSYLAASLLGRARRDRAIAVTTVDLRDYATGPHASVDDRPFGGGPGMVLKLDPIYDALRATFRRARRNERRRTILLSTRGTPFTQVEAQRLARYDHLIFICGRYEGVDERVAAHLADEELSIGPYVLAGGELPALTVIEAVSRLQPGFMHTYESLEDIKGSYPVYTRPESFKRRGMKRAWDVPGALLSGDHARIRAWREQSGGSGE